MMWLWYLAGALLYIVCGTVLMRLVLLPWYEQRYWLPDVSPFTVGWGTLFWPIWAVIEIFIWAVEALGSLAGGHYGRGRR